MIRRFFLENEYGIRWNLNSPQTGLLTSPEGLGYEKNASYSKIGHSFVRNYMKDVQQEITGVLVFGTRTPYVACNQFVKFVNSAKQLKLIYKTIVGEYYRDVDLITFNKTELTRSGVLECKFELLCKGLFYSNRTNRFIVNRTEGELRWDFTWPARFNDYGGREIDIMNDGHVPAALEMEIYGYCENPSLAVLQNDVELYKTTFPVTLQADEKLMYSSADGNLYCIHVDANGVETNMADVLDINQDNFFKLPVGQSVLKFASDTAATNKTILTIYKFFRAV